MIVNDKNNINNNNNNNNLINSNEVLNKTIYGKNYNYHCYL